MALLDALALRDALRAQGRVEDALAAYQHERRRHVQVYQFWSRWLTPLFQSDHDRAARLRDIAFAPLARLPGSRGQMLVETHSDEGQAVNALMKLARAKERKGYVR